MNDEENKKKWNEGGYGKPLFDEKLVMGSLISQISSKSFQDKIVQQLLKNKLLSNSDLLVVSSWGNEDIDQEIISRLAKESVDDKLVFSLLSRRKELKQREKRLLKQVFHQGGTVSGIAAVLLDDNRFIDKLFVDGKEGVLAAVFASSRLLRADLDINKVARYQNSNNLLVSKSAKLYLETHDSSAARKLRQASEPNDILILGARSSFDPEHDAFNSFNKWEHTLKDLFLSQNADETFALISAGFYGNKGQLVLTIKNGKGKLALYLNNGRYKYTTLSKGEVSEFKSFIRQSHIDELGPYIPEIRMSHAIQYEFIHIKPKFGRRVFMRAPNGANNRYKELVSRFNNLLENKSLKIDYMVREKESNVELLNLSEKPKVWLDFNKKYTEIKSECGDDISTWQARVGKLAVYGTAWELYQCIDGNRKVMTDEGSYGRNPIISHDGQWLLSAKLKEADWSHPNHIAVINLTSNQEEILPIEPAQNLDPVVWLENHNKFLLFRSNNDIYMGMANSELATHEYYLYDPKSKLLEKVQGDFLWIEDHYQLPLKVTNEKNIVWMARPNIKANITVVGKYNLDNFYFEKIKTIEGIYFTSKDIWTSENEEDLYVDTGYELLKFNL